MPANDSSLDSSGGWASYYQAVSGTPPRDILVAALDAWEAEFPNSKDKIGVDLACGEGRDTVEFLRRGWQVIAIDSEPMALDLLRRRDDLPATGHLETRLGSMEDAAWDKVDMVNASFALPFCPPDRFPELWSRIVGSLSLGGRFSGNFFGPKDAWASPDLTIVDRDEVDRLLAPFDIEQFEEIDREGTDAKGLDKHWHLFNVVGRMRGGR